MQPDLDQHAASWKDSLTTALYIDQNWYLSTVPHTKDGGITHWVLVDKDQSPNQRQIFCSCESYRQRSLVADEKGNIEEGIVHGIASVFCPSELRGRGYGTRHMKELAMVLYGWQAEHGKSIGSVLYSDIGKEYYARAGWLPDPGNGHLILPSIKMEKPVMAKPIHESELEALCLRDKAMIRKAMATPSEVRKHVVVLPDLDHMIWHIRKEDFVTDYLFGKNPGVRGVIAGSPGKQVWAVWVRRYFKHPENPVEAELDDASGLYILRLVVEGDETANKPYGQLPLSTGAYLKQAAELKAVLQAAQAEAAEWRLGRMKLWEPSPLVESLLRKSGLDAIRVERTETFVSCAQWYSEDSEVAEDAPAWVNNEHYAWC